MLAMLAMLALKGALRVAPGGSAPPIPCAPLRGDCWIGRDGKAGVSVELKSASVLVHAQVIRRAGAATSAPSSFTPRRHVYARLTNHHPHPRRTRVFAEDIPRR